MRFAARWSAWLLPLILCGCAHNVKQAQMQQVLAPPIEEAPPPPDLAPDALPAPAYTIPKTKEPVAVPPEPVKAAPKRHRPASKATSQASAAAAPLTPQPGQVADTPPAAPAEENALGKLETPEAPDSKKQTEASIADIERGLNGIGRQLNDQEVKTSMQIREYLKQARSILSSGDVDGARNLANKAKALLGELSQ